MKIVTICGSMRFAPEMRRAAFRLESRQGCNVLQCTYPSPGRPSPWRCGSGWSRPTWRKSG